MMKEASVPPDPPSHNVLDDASRPMDPIETRGTTPARSWSRAETSSQASRSPESTRRKRLSFFGRSSSEASKEGTPSVDSVMGSQKDSRPGTAQSESRRWTTDPLESILNPPRSNSSSGDTGRSASRQGTSLRSLTGFERAHKPSIEEQEREYYHHRKKTSISPPFNFQHITHTARRHLPRLETVDERDLKSKFWQLHAYQKPKQRLNGIKADNLGIRSRSESASAVQRPITPQQNPEPSNHTATSLKPVATHSPDETLFDETQETKFNPDDAYTSLEDVHNLGMAQMSHTVPVAQHHSSMSALRSPTFSNNPQNLRTCGSFDNTIAPQSVPQSDASRPRVSPPAGQRSTSQPAEDGELMECGLAGRSFREKQPLPPIPQEAASRPTSTVEISPTYSLFPAPPCGAAKAAGKQTERMAPVSGAKQPEAAAPRQIRRSSRSRPTTTTSKSFSSLGTDFLGDSSWEDDIDFAYEQAAEAMCNFNWDIASVRTSQRTNEEGEVTLPSSRPSPELPGSRASSQGGGVRLSAWINRPSALASNSSLSTRQSSDTSVHTQASTNSEAPSVNPQHKRGTSVGHKGFLAARSISSEPLRKSPDFSPQYTSAQAKTPPPKFSLTEADETVDASAYSPATSTTHCPVIDSTIPEYLSDPESDRVSGARHRKSSSYGSVESSQKSTQSLQTSSDAARWSSASTSSIPDLMHSKRKSRSSVHLRGRPSRPLESVPHSPDAEAGEFCKRASVVQQVSVTLPSSWERAPPDPIVMRRPETPGDTSLLLLAGRTVQRDRSSTPWNSRHGVSGITPPAREDKAGWI